MLALYGFDIWDAIGGRVPTRTAFAYIQRLPFEPWSLWRAEQLGGPEHLGWTSETYLLADQVDADKAMLAIKTHRGRGNVKMPDPTYRPKIREDRIKTPEAAPVQSLDDFDINGFLAMMGNG